MNLHKGRESQRNCIQDMVDGNADGDRVSERSTRRGFPRRTASGNRDKSSIAEQNSSAEQSSSYEVLRQNRAEPDRKSA